MEQQEIATVKLGAGNEVNQSNRIITSEAALGELAKEYVGFLSDADADDGYGAENYRDFALERREEALAQGVTEEQWDLAVISAREELALNPVEEISKEELQELAKNYVERLHAFWSLSNQANDLWKAGQEEKANTLWIAVRAIENFAIDNYNNALDQGAIEADWETAVNSASAELSQKHLKDVTSLSIEVLDSHESSEVLVGKKLITFNHEEKILNVTDRQTGYFLQTILSEEGKWEEPSSCFHTAELGSFKQQLSEHLSDRALSNDLSERQKEPQPGRQNDSTRDLEL